MAIEVAKHKNNYTLGEYAQEQWEITLLSTRIIANEVVKQE